MHINYTRVKFLVLTLFLFGCVQSLSAQKIRKTLFVIVDGIPADVIESLPTPALDEIAKVGGYTRAYVGGQKGGYSETPTISAVGYNSLLTGTWYNKHSVSDNYNQHPNYHYWSIFRFFKEQYPQKKTAIFSTWQDNRTVLIGEGLEATGHLKLDYHFDGLELDTITYPHDKNSDYIHRIDEAVVSKAEEYIRKEAPDLSWVYLQYTDDMGHKYGDSPEFYDAVKKMDKQMERLWSAIRFRQENYNEVWEIFITTDHGRTADNGKGHGGQSDRERLIWIVTNAQGLNDYFKKGNPSIVDILPSITRFMNISIPRKQRMELDGIPLTGKIAISNPVLQKKDDKLYITWKAWWHSGNAKIWMSTTNQFKEGGEDQYKLMMTVPVFKRNATIDLKNYPSGFYKIMIETAQNIVNAWLIIE